MWMGKQNEHLNQGHYLQDYEAVSAADMRPVVMTKAKGTIKLMDVKLKAEEERKSALVKRLKDAATMSEAFAVLLPHSEGNATAKLYKEAADAIETLYAAYTESFSVIAQAFRNNPKDLVLREYMMKNACCCCETEESE